MSILWHTFFWVRWKDCDHSRIFIFVVKIQKYPPPKLPVLKAHWLVHPQLLGFILLNLDKVEVQCLVEGHLPGGVGPRTDNPAVDGMWLALTTTTTPLYQTKYLTITTNYSLKVTVWVYYCNHLAPPPQCFLPWIEGHKHHRVQYVCVAMVPQRDGCAKGCVIPNERPWLTLVNHTVTQFSSFL